MLGTLAATMLQCWEHGCCTGMQAVVQAEALPVDWDAVCSLPHRSPWPPHDLGAQQRTHAWLPAVRDWALPRRHRGYVCSCVYTRAAAHGLALSWSSPLPAPQKTVIHPLYKPKNDYDSSWDVAVLILDRTVNVTRNPPAVLAAANLPLKPGTRVWAAGWGRTQAADESVLLR